MQSIPIVLAGLAALAAARAPTREELCVGFHGDFDTCQREASVCFDELHAKEDFTWEKVIKCTQARLPSPSSSAATADAAPTTTSTDKPAPPHSDSTKEEPCVGPNRDIGMWLREFKGCNDEIHAKEGFTMQKVLDCVDARVSSLCSSAASAAAAPTTTPKDEPAPPQNGIADVEGKPTKEELCVGFNGDFDTCQREFTDCFNEIQAEKEVFTWDKIFKCLQGRLPSVHSSAAPPAAAPTTTPKDEPAPPQNSIADVEGKPTKEELCVGFNGDFDTVPSHVLDKRDEVAAETTAEKRRQAATPELPEYNSVLPSLVNGVPLSDSHYLAPKPFGIVIDGKDIFEEAATAAYKKAGFTTVQYLDDWRLHVVLATCTA
ncbi:hypothetical protein BB8028_0001g16580 [Beauveria bassiana]|uniref:Protein-arginine deiminase C-terminal domain-containing protein n=1 Tax=Beauveria bassiana TaxID=176275 RepID=A0A2S7Y0L7_BEABA|nr:hypothetical protein BB8028_0001g16580 [Beauveria bassiana]